MYVKLLRYANNMQIILVNKCQVTNNQVIITTRSML